MHNSLVAKKVLTACEMASRSGVELGYTGWGVFIADDPSDLIIAYRGFRTVDPLGACILSYNVDTRKPATDFKAAPLSVGEQESVFIALAAENLDVPDLFIIGMMAAFDGLSSEPNNLLIRSEREVWSEGYETGEYIKKELPGVLSASQLLSRLNYA